MKQKTWLTALAAGILMFAASCSSINHETDEEREGVGDYSGPAQVAAREFRMTKDPALGTVPRNRLVQAMQYTENLRGIFNRVDAAGIWTERGSNSDTVGVSNGNTRANSGITSGRVRAVLVDANDGTGNTVWVGGVNGGLWKTTDISASPATWSPQTDFFTNMAISSICQNPASPQTMYFATGEGFFNADAVAGDGIWKSTNGGTTWAQLPSTTGASFDYCTKIICDNSGNVYVTTRSGVFRSTDGGSTWVTITPSGLSTSRFSDIELSSTGRLHVSAGIFSTCGYRFTDNPATVTAGTWTSATSGYPTSSVRIELGCNGNTLYALPSDGSYQVPIIYKSTDGGATWAATAGSPTAGWASQQAWYALAIDTDPADANNVIVGGLESYKSTNGGTSWTRISRWVGTTGQYVHADIHFIDWYSGNRLLYGCDGGIHYSSDANNAAPTIRDRNVGLRIKQFYSCDCHPTVANYYLAGAQDNGCHRFRAAGLAGSTEVIGGDGGFMNIDQNETSYQFGTYVYNVYRRSTNGGNNWSTVTFYRGSPGTYNVNYFDFGDFINPYDYDNTANILYGGADANEFFRWTTPQTTAAGTYYSNTTFGTANAAIVSLTNLGGGAVSSVMVSPYTANRVYFGGSNGRVLYLDGADVARTDGTTAAGVNITGASFPSGTVSCVAVGTNDNNLMATFANYGVNNVWVTTNGGTSWTAIDGNLPDMPVRWAIFYPGDNTKAIIATEAGVYITELINGGSTSWYPSPTFPLVRTDMIKYNSGQSIVVAATHGRGLWTQSAATLLPLEKFQLSGFWQGENTVNVQWNYDIASTQSKFEVYASYNGKDFEKVGNLNYNGGVNYSFSHQPASGRVFYRIRAIEKGVISKYSNVIKLDRNRVFNGIDLQTPSPNPVQNIMTVQFDTESQGLVTLEVIAPNGSRMIYRVENITARGTYTRQMDVSKLAAGAYTLMMRKDGVQLSRKFVKL